MAATVRSASSREVTQNLGRFCFVRQLRNRHPCGWTRTRHTRTHSARCAPTNSDIALPCADHSRRIDFEYGIAPPRHGSSESVNLHWHDLRHEYASRLVERGVPLPQVRDLLGHASITTTERYDNQKLENLQAEALKLESAESFDSSGTSRIENRVDDADKASSFFQEKAKALGSTMKRAITKSVVSERVRKS